ncbi:MAG: 16S rRNA (adenine(1518)-N(6)/adenine(1519)-N(6))-dimethyltransferase RsmA [Clostridia bacterium]|nr:16S rRNA (adenine(1518)-N(6)/adenine(1519)-N(6))-dimethyltransferase RsmA [Clostridia bacterium]
MDLTNPSTIKEIMNRLGVKFNKSLGQNFLIDKSVIDCAISASGIDKTYGVLEIGPGIGTLTAELSKNAGKVAAIELDRNIAKYLCDAFIAYDNVTIIQGDALKMDLNKIIEEYFGKMPVAVVSNLPYYITTPIIMKLFEDNLPLMSVTVMIQKEVAERFTAKPGTKEYGAISLSVQYYSTPNIVKIVPPESFMPQPKVTSAVICMDIKNHIKPSVKDEKMMFKIIKAAFNQRRKTLVNALSSAVDKDKEMIKNIVKSVTGSEKIRGEELDLCQFIQISEKFI